MQSAITNNNNNNADKPSSPKASSPQYWTPTPDRAASPTYAEVLSGRKSPAAETQAQALQQNAETGAEAEATTEKAMQDSKQSGTDGQADASQQTQPADQPGTTATLAKAKKAGKGKGKGRAKGKASRPTSNKNQARGTRETGEEPAHETRSISESRKRRRVTGETVSDEQVGTTSIVRDLPGASFAQTARALDRDDEPATEALTTGTNITPQQAREDNIITFASDSWNHLQKTNWGNLSMRQKGKTPYHASKPTHGPTDEAIHIKDEPASPGLSYIDVDEVMLSPDEDEDRHGDEDQDDSWNPVHIYRRPNEGVPRWLEEFNDGKPSQYADTHDTFEAWLARPRNPKSTARILARQRKQAETDADKRSSRTVVPGTACTPAPPAAGRDDPTGAMREGPPDADDLWPAMQGPIAPLDLSENVEPTHPEITPKPSGPRGWPTIEGDDCHWKTKGQCPHQAEAWRRNKQNCIYINVIGNGANDAGQYGRTEVMRQQLREKYQVDFETARLLAARPPQGTTPRPNSEPFLYNLVNITKEQLAEMKKDQLISTRKVTMQFIEREVRPPRKLGEWYAGSFPDPTINGIKRTFTNGFLTDYLTDGFTQMIRRDTDYHGWASN